MAGGIAVVCGAGAENESSVLGYRPCVGMVEEKSFSAAPGKLQQGDAKLFTNCRMRNGSGCRRR